MVRESACHRSQLESRLRKRHRIPRVGEVWPLRASLKSEEVDPAIATQAILSDVLRDVAPPTEQQRDAGDAQSGQLEPLVGRIERHHAHERPVAVGATSASDLVSPAEQVATLLSEEQAEAGAWDRRNRWL
jgi:hypothetical protein